MNIFMKRHASFAIGLLVASAAFVAPLRAEETRSPAPEAVKSEAAPAVQWQHAYPEAKEQAAKAKKPMLLDFYADG